MEGVYKINYSGSRDVKIKPAVDPSQRTEETSLAEKGRLDRGQRRRRNESYRLIKDRHGRNVKD